MATINDVFSEFLKAINRAGSQNKLALLSEVPQSTINELVHGKKKMENLALSNFFKLFPDMEINFLGAPKDPSLIGQIQNVLTFIPASEHEKVLKILNVLYPNK